MIFHSVLVTGANRGIGLQFVREFLKLGNNKIANVIATYRDPKTNDDLNELAKSNNHLALLQLDIKNYASHNEFRDKLAQIAGDKGLSLLLNNAGVAVPTNFDTATPEKMIENFEMNAVTPLMLSKSLLPLLEQSSKGGQRTLIAHISSQKGSIGDNLVMICMSADCNLSFRSKFAVILFQSSNSINSNQGNLLIESPFHLSRRAASMVIVQAKRLLIRLVNRCQSISNENLFKWSCCIQVRGMIAGV